MKRIILLTVILLIVIAFSGCSLIPEKKEEEKTINPFSVDSMVDTYDDSKAKINNNVQKENDKINNALEESGLK